MFVSLASTFLAAPPASVAFNSLSFVAPVSAACIGTVLVIAPAQITVAKTANKLFARISVTSPRQKYLDV
jgi:hypothetical protein